MLESGTAILWRWRFNKASFLFKISNGKDSFNNVCWLTKWLTCTCFLGGFLSNGYRLFSVNFAFKTLIKRATAEHSFHSGRWLGLGGRFLEQWECEIDAVFEQSGRQGRRHFQTELLGAPLHTVARFISDWPVRFSVRFGCGCNFKREPRWNGAGREALTRIS